MVLFNQFKLKQVYLNSKPNVLNKVIAPTELDKANPKCYVRSPQPDVTVLNISTMTVQSFVDKVLKGALNMLSPDVMIDDGKGTVLISSEKEETTDNISKFRHITYDN